MTLVGVLLAGCTTEPSPAEAPIPVLSLASRGLPAQIELGDSATFNLVVTGDRTTTSDHIGGHYWDDSTDEPTADFAAALGACQHVAGSNTVPGQFTIVCTPTQEGWHYVRGHVRLTIGDDTLDYWTAEHVVFVQPAT